MVSCALKLKTWLRHSADANLKTVAYECLGPQLADMLLTHLPPGIHMLTGLQIIANLLCESYQVHNWVCWQSDQLRDRGIIQDVDKGCSKKMDKEHASVFTKDTIQIGALCGTSCGRPASSVETWAAVRLLWVL